MGRLSAAVAHEIRNPLAAISQANALLEEDLTDPHQRQLTTMISHNAKRLDKIVEDVLNASRISPSTDSLSVHSIALQEQTVRVCHEWAAQHGASQHIELVQLCANVRVRFESEHLRRVLINLLDNAHRYASQAAGSILVHIAKTQDQTARLTVWSDGPPLESSVQEHLFEPFFSSESRSSGLGLFICRELCEQYGAHIEYSRCNRTGAKLTRMGNAFVITVPTSQTMESWQPLLQ
jgi:two-component system sensor histidine kinase PilS (NtrC family)